MDKVMPPTTQVIYFISVIIINSMLVNLYK